MKVLNLDFHGARVRASSPLDSVLEPLRRDFEYFLALTPAGRPEIRIQLHLEPPPRIHKRSIGDDGPVRTIHYRDGALAVYDYARKEGEIFCPRIERLHELAYQAILSRVGEEWDASGRHRIHALGFEREGRGGLLLLPSGGGKSVVGLELLQRSDCGILSDDSPVLSDSGRLLALPLPLGLKNVGYLDGIPKSHIQPFIRLEHGLKWTVALDYFRTQVRTDVPVEWLLIGRRTENQSPRIEPISRLSAFSALLVNLVIGAGLVQMKEYMIRKDPRQLLRLAGIGFSRLWRAISLTATVPSVRFVMGPDSKENCEVLLRFIGGKPRPKMTPRSRPAPAHFV